MYSFFLLYTATYVSYITEYEPCTWHHAAHHVFYLNLHTWVDVGNFGNFWTTPILQPVHIAVVALVADAIHDRNRVIPSCPNMEVIFA